MSSSTGDGQRPRTRALVLAAGRASRFGADKLAARVDGRSLLAVVLDRLADAGLLDAVVVVAPGGGQDPPAGARRVENPDPARGLASSLRVGWAEAVAIEPVPEAVLIALGDQPLLDPAVVRRILDAPLDSARPIVAARHRSGARNPVRVELPGASLVATVAGDRGLGPLLDAAPELVRWMDVARDVDNPDVDTREDLARVAELLWAERVRRNREQVDRFREVEDGRDFYAQVSGIFRDDPHREGDPVVEALLRLAQPADTWLDIGAGAGRYALPLARAVQRVIALDPSPAMLAELRAAAGEHGIANVEVVEGRWPEAARTVDRSDVALIAQVGYDVEAIGPFLDAMEAAAARRCVAVLMERGPASLAEPFWPEIHGERRISLPALPAFIDLLRARGRDVDVTMLDASRRRWSSRDELVRALRRQTWVEPGSAKDGRLLELVDRWIVPSGDGLVDLRVSEPLRVGVVTWSPPQATATRRA